MILHQRRDGWRWRGTTTFLQESGIIKLLQIQWNVFFFLRVPRASRLLGRAQKELNSCELCSRHCPHPYAVRLHFPGPEITATEFNIQTSSLNNQILQYVILSQNSSLLGWTQQAIYRRWIYGVCYHDDTTRRGLKKYGPAYN